MRKRLCLNPSTCACEINRYLKCYAYMKSLIADLVITCAKS